MSKNPDLNSETIEYARRLQKLRELSPHHGSHSSFARGHCAMELVSWLAGETFSASPECACPVLGVGQVIEQLSAGRKELVG